MSSNATTVRSPSHVRGVGDPDCETCRGLGYIRFEVPIDDERFGKLFRCPTCGHIAARERRKTIFQSKRERVSRYTVTRPDQTFETFRARDVTPLVREAYLVALQFAEEPRGWLVLHGPPGTGKSHLASAIANRCADWIVMSLVLPDLLEFLRSGYESGDYTEVLELCRTVDLLIVDDMGTESATPWAYEKVFQIINHRYNKMLPSVFVSNCELEEFEPRIASRLRDRRVSRVIRVYGSDYRERRSP